MPFDLKRAVGRNLRSGRAAPNLPEDVRKVQTLLRLAHQVAGSPRHLISADGVAGPETIEAVAEFQQSRWVSADGVVEPDGATWKVLTQIASNPVSQVLREGDTSKSDPFTILFIANPALEMPWNSGTFGVDPVTYDQQAFNTCVGYALDCLFGNLPGQRERLLADPAISAKVRVISVFRVGLTAEDQNALVAEDGVSNLLVARRGVFAQFIANLGLQADVVYAISQSASHTRASSWFTSDNDAGPGIDFVLDGVTRSHRFYNLTPGTVAIHTTARSLTPLHEFGHALSSYTNGAIVDLYVDNGPALNNKRGRPIPGQFATYSGDVLEADTSRAGIGYPSGWQSFHCELLDTESPAVMDNYFLASAGSEVCQHDKITREFLRDRLLAKLYR